MHVLVVVVMVVVVVAQLTAGDFSKNRRTDLFGVCVNGKILRGVLCMKRGQRFFWMNKPCHIHKQVNFDDDDGGDDKSIFFIGMISKQMCFAM